MATDPDTDPEAIVAIEIWATIQKTEGTSTLPLWYEAIHDKFVRWMEDNGFKFTMSTNPLTQAELEHEEFMILKAQKNE